MGKVEFSAFELGSQRTLGRRHEVRLHACDVLKRHLLGDFIELSTRCQSFGNPSTEEYWHMGETAIRFRMVMSLIVNGSKSLVIVF